jgi:hypothetical protein
MHFCIRALPIPPPPLPSPPKPRPSASNFTTHSSLHCSIPACSWCPSWSATCGAVFCSSAQQLSRHFLLTPKTFSSSAATSATGALHPPYAFAAVFHWSLESNAGAIVLTTLLSTSLPFVSLFLPHLSPHFTTASDILCMRLLQRPQPRHTQVGRAGHGGDLQP